MKRLFGLLVLGSVFGIGYVLVNGVGGTYQLFGADGPVLSGGRIIVAALAILVGVAVFGAASAPSLAGPSNRGGKIVTSLGLFALAGYMVVSAPFGADVAAATGPKIDLSSPYSECLMAVVSLPRLTYSDIPQAAQIYADGYIRDGGDPSKRTETTSRCAEGLRSGLNIRYGR